MGDKFIPQYVADESLGEGAFGKVFRIHNQRAEDFALKVWKAKTPEAMLRLESEVKVLARLAHPNLIRLYEYLPQAQAVKGIEDKGPGLVMEFVPGDVLGVWLKGRAFPELEALFAQALRALSYLHTRHLMHGDLKPDNLKVTKKGILKILDFGLAGPLEPELREVAGTLDYLAPEALRGEREARGDLFSLAAVFYEALTGKKPYEAGVDRSRRFLVPPLSVSELNKEVPEYFGSILGRMLEAEANRRFSTAGAALRALNRHAEKPYDLVEAAARQPGAEETPFLGRQEFLKRAEILFREWTEEKRKFPVLLLFGGAGTGKSRLAREFAWQALLRGLESRNATVEDFLEKGAGEGPADTKALIVLEDIHRATPRQLNELAKALEAGKVRWPQLGFVLSWNAELTEAAAAERFLALAASLGAELFEVGNFSSEEVRSALQESLDEPQVPADWIANLETLTEGNPALLFACLNQRRAAGGGIPHPSRPEWESVELPPDYRRTLNAKWDRLGHEERRAVMESVLLRRPDEFGFGAQRPLFRRFWIERFGAPETQALQKKLFAERRGADGEPPLLLAELAKGAGETEAFRGYAVQAAEQLLRVGEAEWAIELFRQVLQARPPRDQEALVWAYLAAAYSRLSRFDEALEAYDKWYERTEDDGSKIQTLKYHYLVGTLLSNWGKSKKSAEHFLKALQSGDSAAHPAHVPFHLKSYSSLGRLSEQEGKVETARDYYERGLALAKTDSPEKSILLRNLGVFWLHQNDRSRGRYYLEAALKMSRDLHYDEGLVNASFLLANLAKREGRQGEALNIYGRVLEMAQRKQDPLKEGRTHSNMAAVLIEMGDYGHAEEQALKAEPLLARGAELDRFLNRYHLATIGAFLGQFTRADDVELHALGRRVGRLELSAHLERLKGEALRLQRDYRGALQALARARAGFKKAKDDEEVNATVLLEVFCECLAGDLAAARERLALWKENAADPHALAAFHRLAEEALAWESSPGTERVMEAARAALGSAQQEWVILALRAVSEILLRLEDQESAERLRQKAYEWLDGMYRSLPEEMQLSFEHREDFERLAEAHRRKLKSTGISRERFLTFTRINHRLSETSDMRAILEQVMDAAMALAGADRGFLLTNEKKKTSQVIPGFRVESARNMKKETVSGEEFKISLSVIQEAIRRRVTLLTDNAQADPQFKHAESVHLYGLKSILVLPLLGEKECLGVIYLDHRFEVGAFSDEILMFLKAFADQSVLAIEKARVLGELSRANRSLSNRVEEQAYQIENLETQLQEARKNLRFGYEEIIAHSPKMIQILQLLDRITDTRVPVWIHGESGTGKELIARALHYNSDRKEKPFIAENCSAIPENLLESVLFGHVKGAFTHAEKDKMGLFEAANGGTMFLDEIGDMPMTMQAKLLRVLQEGEVKRVGANQAVKVDVRVVSATNKNLPELVKQGKFREDLFFRLNGMRIDLPPLRDRKEDIPLLAQHFIEKVAEENSLKPCGISEGAFKILANYDWPGNIRELENAMRNAVIFGDGKTIGSDSLGFKPELFGPIRPKTPPPSEAPEAPRVLEGVEREREAILDALVKAHYHKGAAAKELKVTPRHLYNLLEKYRLPKNKWALKKLVEEERK